MPYNFVDDSFHTKKLCSRLPSSEVRSYPKNGLFSFLSSLLRGLGAHLRLIGKRVVDFILVLIELFSLVLRLRRYKQISVQNRRFRFNGTG